MLQSHPETREPLLVLDENKTILVRDLIKDPTLVPLSMKQQMPPEQLLQYLATLPVFDLKNKEIIKTITSKLDKHENEEKTKWPWERLKPYQQDSVVMAHYLNGRIAILDEPGLGKTVQALSIWKYLQPKQTMIVCPKTLIDSTWKQILVDDYGISKNQIFVLKDKKSHEKYAQDSKYFRFVLVSYESLKSKFFTKNLPSELEMVIFDESQKLKNEDSQQTIKCTMIGTLVKYVTLLSGTIMSKARHLYPTFRLLHPQLFHTFYKSKATKKDFFYGNRYCVPTEIYYHNKKAMTFDGSDKLEEIYHLTRCLGILRRLKIVEVPELLDKNRYVWKFKLSPEEEKICVEDKIILDSIKNKNSIEYKSMLSKMHSKQSKMRVPYVIDQVKTKIIPSTNKHLIFALHNVMMDALENLMIQEKKTYFVIKGNVSIEKRGEFVKEYESKSSNTQFAILNIQAAQAGITLKSASESFFAELDNNHANILQAEDRNHRIGQEKQVNTSFSIGEKTLDEQMYRAIDRKILIASQALDNDRQRFYLIDPNKQDDDDDDDDNDEKKKNKKKGGQKKKKEFVKGPVSVKL
jgi:SWI/SNF-related matrix-associated actin-dependent regulator 1 of chromatin subfamily A